MKIIELIKAKKCLESVCNEKVNVKLAYKLMKFLSAAQIEEAFYDLKMKEIINEFSEKGEDGTPLLLNGGVKISEDKINECNMAIKELSEIEVEAPKISFTIDELEGIKISANELLALSEFIDE